MKVLQTNYNGILFRSRHEARWAVFFDAMEWEYEYENYGFELDGVNYLPDFYLPKFKAFIEVKPNAEIKEEWKIKCILLSKHTQKEVLLLNGTPEFKYYIHFHPISDDVYENVVAICYNHKEDYFWIDSGHHKDKLEREYFTDRYKEAVRKAKSERFGY